MMRHRITGDMTLAQLEQLIDEANIRIAFVSRRLDDNNRESPDGKLLFSVDDFASFGDQLPSRTGVLMEGLAAALDDALHREVKAQSPVGLRCVAIAEATIAEVEAAIAEAEAEAAIAEVAVKK